MRPDRSAVKAPFRGAGAFWEDAALGTARSLADQRANLLVALLDLAHQLLGKVGDLLRDLANVTATVVGSAARASPSPIGILPLARSASRG